jgi:predicted lysophospholipase L1 biosynthesis ABC-type transport system permease subunit
MAMVIDDVRARKVVADLRGQARGEIVLASLAVLFGQLSLLVWPPAQPVVGLGVLSLVLLVIGQATRALGQQRAAEQRLLRALGASDAFAMRLAVLEGALLGGLAGVLGLGLSLAGAFLLSSHIPTVPTLGVWLVGCALSGAVGARLGGLGQP